CFTFLGKVGVFVNETTARVNEIIELTGIDIVQLHGQEPPEYCQKLERKVIKAFRIASNFNLEQLGAYKVDAYLLDTYVKGIYGGTGESFDWEIAKRAKRYGRIILGGLNPGNIKAAVGQVSPYAVDIGSGVEIRPGKKER
ncbi:MAG: N-(5'-phosphoribosyl)anthranilate isomerase, partial [Candidatus Latescibacterota bacterium]